MTETCVHVVGTLEDIAAGTATIVPIGRWGVGVFNVGGRFYALTNRCPHMGAPLCRGPVTGTASSDEPHSARWIREGEILRCPWHGWEFDIATGETLTRPTRRVQSLRAGVDRDGNVWVEHDPRRDPCGGVA